MNERCPSCFYKMNTLLPFVWFLREKIIHSLNVTSRKQMGTWFPYRFMENIIKVLSLVPGSLHQQLHTKHLLTAWIPNSSLGVSCIHAQSFGHNSDRMSYIKSPWGDGLKLKSQSFKILDTTFWRLWCTNKSIGRHVLWLISIGKFHWCLLTIASKWLRKWAAY